MVAVVAESVLCEIPVEAEAAVVHLSYYKTQQKQTVAH
jgi:hypothetical protein